MLGRYWLITNGNGRETEVQGEGVVTSSHLSRLAKSTSTPAVQSLKPRLGTMQGHYEIIDENGVPFSIDIPVFRLAVPHSFIKRYGDIPYWRRSWLLR
ncbi:ApaG domain-containing protein [Escherichia coli]